MFVDNDDDGMFLLFPTVEGDVMVANDDNDDDVGGERGASTDAIVVWFGC